MGVDSVVENGDILALSEAGADKVLKRFDSQNLVSAPVPKELYFQILDMFKGKKVNFDNYRVTEEGAVSRRITGVVSEYVDKGESGIEARILNSDGKVEIVVLPPMEKLGALSQFFKGNEAKVASIGEAVTAADLIKGKGIFDLTLAP